MWYSTWNKFLFQVLSMRKPATSVLLLATKPKHIVHWIYMFMGSTYKYFQCWCILFKGVFSGSIDELICLVSSATIYMYVLYSIIWCTSYLIVIRWLHIYCCWGSCTVHFFWAFCLVYLRFALLLVIGIVWVVKLTALQSAYFLHSCTLHFCT